MTDGRNSLAAWRAAVSLGWDIAPHAPLPFLAVLLIQVANGARNGLYAWLTAGVINGLVTGRGAVGATAWLAAVLVMENLSWTYMWPARSWLTDLAVLRVEGRVLARASEEPLLRFSDPEWLDLLSRGTSDIGDRMGRWLGGIFDLLGAVVQVAGMLAAVFALGGGVVMVVALVAASAVNILSQGRLAGVELRRSQRQARPRREAAAWSGLLSLRGAAAEVRTFDLGDWLRAQWESAYRACAAEDLAASGRRLRWGGVSNAADVGAYVAVLVLAGQAALRTGPDRAAGVFVALLEAALQMQGFFANLLGTAGNMHEHSTLVGDLAPLLFGAGGGMAVPPPPAQGPPTDPRPTAVPVAVHMESLTFRYPRADGDAVADLTASVRPGEVVALVGPNGAGKSTLAALTLGLLDPAKGSVQLVGGAPAGARLSAVFQDFVRYTLPVRDNVGFGALDLHAAETDLREALRQSGSHLASGDLDAWLGPEFDGTDLSGGEWLRVALARGALARPGLIVLDEPTAAIDPLAEVEIVRRLLEVGRQRTAIVVSHRLGIARAADRILVLDHGRLVEEGHHDDLLRQDGLYAQMWRAQASWYAPQREGGAAEPGADGGG